MTTLDELLVNLRAMAPRAEHGGEERHNRELYVQAADALEAAAREREMLREALEKLHYFAVAFIAFHNRDRSTERMGQTLDGLLTEALVCDGLARNALSGGPHE